MKMFKTISKINLIIYNSKLDFIVVRLQIQSYFLVTNSPLYIENIYATNKYTYFENIY